MGTVSLVGAHYAVGLDRGLLVVRSGGQRVRTVRPRDLEELHLHGAATLSGPARSLLLRRGIDVVFLDAGGRYLGRLAASDTPLARRRIDQYRLSSDLSRRRSIAAGIVASKIANQRAMLLRRQRRRRSTVVGDILGRLRSLVSRATQTETLDELRGVEGLAARLAFIAMGHQLGGTDLAFAGRNRRPPLDLPNACLSFAYTLMVTTVRSAVRTAGLDEHLGILHETARGAPALALDLAEPLRPEVDDLVWTVLNRGQITAEETRCPSAEELGVETVPAGATWLTPLATKILVGAWNDRLTRSFEHPERPGQTWPLRLLVDASAQQIVRIAAGEQDRFHGIRIPCGR